MELSLQKIAISTPTKTVRQGKPKQLNKLWATIQSTFFFAIIKFNSNMIVIDTEANVKYMLGWTLEQVEEHCQTKDWELVCS